MTNVTMRKTLCVLSFLICLAASSCAMGLVKFTVNGDGSISDPEGTTYKYWSVSVSPVHAGDKYGRASGGYELYRVDGLDPSYWLCEGSGAISLVYAEQSVVQPESLASFEPDGAVLRIEMDEKDIPAGEIDDGETVSGIVRLLESEDEAPLPSGVSQVMDICFTSAKYPGLYYTVQYITDSGGTSYLRDRGAGICVLARDVLGLGETQE